MIKRAKNNGKNPDHFREVTKMVYFSVNACKNRVIYGIICLVMPSLSHFAAISKISPVSDHFPGIRQMVTRLDHFHGAMKMVYFLLNTCKNGFIFYKISLIGFFRHFAEIHNYLILSANAIFWKG